MLNEDQEIQELADESAGINDQNLLNWIRLHVGIYMEVNRSKYFQKEQKDFMNMLWEIYGNDFKKIMRER